MDSYQKALQGIKRCNKPALWHSIANGYKVCRECYDKEGEHVLFERVSESYGDLVVKCDRPVDGLGAMNWSKRLELAR